MPKKAKKKALPDYYKILRNIHKLGGKTIDDPEVLANYDIHIAHHHYKKTGNLLFIWDAYRQARTANIPIPPWVEKYIDKVAERVLSVKEYSPEAVEYMMGFRKTPEGPGTGGGASLIKQRENYLLKQYVIDGVIISTKRFPDKSVTDICNIFSKLIFEEKGIEIQGETIKEWYYERKS